MRTLLKDIFEQAIYSEGSRLVNWKINIYVAEYTYVLESGLAIRITINAPFIYKEEQLLELIHKDIIQIIKLELW